MTDIIKGIGEITVSLIILAIPMLLAIGLYENWCDFIKLILIMLFIGDICVVGLMVHDLQDL